MQDNPSADKDGQLPITNISWHDCQQFIQRLQADVDGLSLGLPSEAQWEYACRADSQTAYWWGDEFNEDYVNKGSNMKREQQLPANDFGLRSMSGNVWEWCEDVYAEYPAQALSRQDKPDGQPRVLRGGSWIGRARFLRSAYRFAHRPDNRSLNFGLRLAGGFDPQAGGARQLSADSRSRSGEAVSTRVTGKGRVTADVL